MDVFPARSSAANVTSWKACNSAPSTYAWFPPHPWPTSPESFYVFDLPYLFTDTKTTYEVLDGDIGTSLLKDIAKDGFTGLGYWQNGFFNAITEARGKTHGSWPA